MGINYPPGLSEIICHLQIKFLTYFHVFRGKRFNDAYANLRECTVIPEIQDGRRKKRESNSTADALSSKKPTKPMFW
jgi:hypothetical protein